MAESVGLGALLPVDLECEPLGLVVGLRLVVVGSGHHRGLQSSVMVRADPVVVTLSTHTVLHPLVASVTDFRDAGLLRSWSSPVAVLYSPVSARPLL